MRVVSGTAVDCHQSLRIGIGQRSQQNRIHNTENCRIGPDAQRQSNDRQQTEPW